MDARPMVPSRRFHVNLKRARHTFPRVSTFPLQTNRFIFTSLYAEIRFILESNLMKRFLSTSEFKTALAEDPAEGCAFGGVVEDNPQMESVPP